ncbi:integrase [Mycobacterium marseillense]|uniref:tyrosine-type recombinase/integrase n=1 Tax=Mycobacterium marseillense TaxID=701042 RepID=UPI0007FBC00A|nr:site-specific integrase [Mycobacterium marseillense]MCA2263961.1 site-specific integrase [Mycobacterium marseillense]OBJ76007.1 integrase [Mycobacterium marseillense]
MASVRIRTRKDGSTYYAVLYRHAGKQTSTSFAEEKQAQRFRELIGAVGSTRAMEVAGIADTTPLTMSSLSVAEFLERHIASLTGVEKKTVSEYRRYLRNDIGPAIGSIPLKKLTREDVAGWVNGMAEDGASGKTIQNKHGFLSGALSRAVEAGELTANPCHRMKMPRTEKRPYLYLTRDEFQILKAAFSDHYQPFVEFLVASGCRFSEAVALRPTDIDREKGTVRVTRAWHAGGPDGYYLGSPKTEKSVRTINVPVEVLDQLDYSGEWLFLGTNGNPIRLYSWRANVWYKSLKKAQQNGLERTPCIRDLRTTCGSWMVQSGIDLAVVQDHLGHDSYETTRRHYAHLNRRNHEVAAEAISRMLA